MAFPHVRYNWRPYEEYREWVRSMGFRNYKQLLAYTTTHILPEGFPVSPRVTYADEYTSDQDFFGERPPIILPYQDALRIVRRLNFADIRQYQEYVRKYELQKREMRLPSEAGRSYAKDGWVSWGHYLGTGTVATHKRKYLPYKDAIAFVHQLGFTGVVDWWEYSRNGHCPNNIPNCPWSVYDEYVGIKAWLGTDVVQYTTTRLENNGVICIYHDPYDPSNVLSYNVFKGGKVQAEHECKDRFNIVRLYKFEIELMDEFNRIITGNSTSFEDRQFITNNYHQMQFELDNILEIVPK